MRKLLLLSIFFALACAGMAQKFEITPFGGYAFPANWNGSYGYLHFNGNAQYGGMFSASISRVVDVEFMYNRIDTQIEPNFTDYLNETSGVSENFYMIGVTKNFRVSPKVSPFVGFYLGGVYMAPDEAKYYDYWFFAMGLDAGAKIYLSNRIGLRLQAQLLTPINGGGFTFYYGTGGGGTGAYLNSALFDFGFTGGLIFRLGKINQ